jgi:hypothetical protein
MGAVEKRKREWEERSSRLMRKFPGWSVDEAMAVDLEEARQEAATRFKVGWVGPIDVAVAVE